MESSSNQRSSSSDSQLDPLLPPTSAQIADAQTTAQIRVAAEAEARRLVSEPAPAATPAPVPAASGTGASGAVSAVARPGATGEAPAGPGAPAPASPSFARTGASAPVSQPTGPVAPVAARPADAGDAVRNPGPARGRAAAGTGQPAQPAPRAARPDRSPTSAGAPVVPDGLADRPQARRKVSDDPRTRRFVRRRRALVGVVLAVSLTILVTLIMRWSPLFEIHRITASPTEHISSTTISTLAAVPEGATLFNVDVRGIQNRISANPWVDSVHVGRTLPDQLDIYVVERKTVAIVMMSNGTEAWRISNSGYWLEPIALREANSTDDKVDTPLEQARSQAASDGVVFVTDTSATLRPAAGKACDDDGVNALLSYLAGFGPDLRNRIVSSKASSREALSVTLSNGVEISLGAPNDIGVKEQVILNMLREHADEVTFINVRVTTAPTWRGVTSGDTVAVEAADPVVDQRSAEEEIAAAAQSQTAEGGPAEGVTWSQAMSDGGYYDEYGDWIWCYYDADGDWIHGYYDAYGDWIQLSDGPN